MSAKAALIEFLAASRSDARDGALWDDGAIVASFVPGTATGMAVWLDRDKTLPTVAGIEQTTLGTDGSVTLFGDGVYDFKIYDKDDSLLATPLKTFESVNIQDAQVGATLTDPDFLDGTDATKIGSWDMSQISSGTTRTYTLPDADTTFIGADSVDVLQNKKLEDSTCSFVDNADNTKDAFFSLGGATTGKTLTLISSHTDDRSVTFPDKAGTLATTDDVSAIPGLVQVVTVEDSAAASGTTAMPYDTSIPQITEGDQYMSATITPTLATNIIIVEAFLVLASTGTEAVTLAMFNTDVHATNAISASPNLIGAANRVVPQSIFFEAVASALNGTTATTFTFRAGKATTGATTRFNDDASGTGTLGGVIKSVIKISELKASIVT